MKTLIALAFTQLVFARPSDLPWHPPGHGDVRSPCPMLNALANHGILPHDGKGITRDHILNAFTPVLNFDTEFAESLHKLGLTTTLNPNATTFDFTDLRRHDIVEADSSLSRADAYFGDNYSFNKTIWDASLSHWTGPIMDIPGSAAAVASRVRDSRENNPQFSLKGERLESVTGGAAFFTTVLGDHVTGTVDKSFVRELFECERLPIAKGWKKSEKIIKGEFVGELTKRVWEATGLTADESPSMKKRGVLRHGGLSLTF